MKILFSRFFRFHFFGSLYLILVPIQRLAIDRNKVPWLGRYQKFHLLQGTSKEKSLSCVRGVACVTELLRIYNPSNATQHKCSIDKKIESVVQSILVIIALDFLDVRS